MKTRIAVVVLSLAFAGITVARGLNVSRMTEDELQAKVHAAPQIKHLGAQRLSALPAGTQIEVYFKKFNPHDMPSPKEQFSMGAGSAPAWKPTRIASITMYRFDHADPIALASLKKVAASIGGIALINLQREPVLLKGSLKPRRGEANWAHDIIGYAYYADVVVKR